MMKMIDFHKCIRFRIKLQEKMADLTVPIRI